MCTVIVRTGEPLTLLGVRDEFADRPWEGPGEHWPEYPGVVGGRDLKAGGTWLAALPSRDRVAALLNGRGLPADERTKISRGELPLRAVVAGGMPEVDLPRYDPFHLVLAGRSGARMWSWDGERLTAAGLPVGTSVIVNSGRDDDPKAVELRPLFAAAADWHDLVEAATVRHELPDGRVYASLSATLVTVGGGGLGYEFSDLSRWNAVRLPRVDRGVSRDG
ncbi:NRDE family protein [Nonomuraea sp. bgisy101]|uniref:NRDE family protein n=1 Tax=Nonomuraea sp. bgisy101 TaxID=3413784 RepID=UPI003D723164